VFTSFSREEKSKGKSEARNTKSETNSKPEIQMNKTGKQYDLEERTLEFAKRVRRFVKRLPKTIANLVDIKQLIRASGSVGANYIEANDSLSKKDFAMRIKICRKEAKESRFWLRLVDTGKQTELEQEREELINESQELMNIFGAILQKVK
jgi:four helix bundle protein